MDAWHRADDRSSWCAESERAWEASLVVERTLSWLHQFRWLRVRYTPYGQAQAFPKADINNDGSASTSDLTTLLPQIGSVINDGTYTAEADLNHDGSITTSDLTIYLGASGTSIPASDLSALNSIVGYNGYLYEQATGLYCVRNRWYEPNTGRWTSRDPAGYVDGMNLYRYGRANPLTYTDPMGLASIGEAVKKYCRSQCSRSGVIARLFYGICVDDCMLSLDKQDKFNLWYQSEMLDQGWLKEIPDCPSKITVYGGKPRIVITGIGEKSLVQTRNTTQVLSGVCDRRVSMGMLSNAAIKRMGL